jgi:hypothetical protein
MSTIINSYLQGLELNVLKSTQIRVYICVKTVTFWKICKHIQFIE